MRAGLNIQYFPLRCSNFAANVQFSEHVKRSFLCRATKPLISVVAKLACCQDTAINAGMRKLCRQVGGHLAMILRLQKLDIITYVQVALASFDAGVV
jgi:hypothetical protein